jgi:hypothetical protein
LDEKHKKLILQELNSYQTFVTSIREEPDYNYIIKLN